MGFSVLLEEQNKDVGRKLGIATALMFTLPFITYFIAFYYLFPHKAEPSNWAGGCAVFMTNVVVVGYVLVAFNEEDDTPKEGERGYVAKNDGDERHPRTGIYKQRVD